ncbi:MAG: hypothetical protein ACYTGN_18610 [Planctomycetota bacterium]|jgi:hypothetical protein
MEDKSVVVADELRFINDVLARTESRIDPHAFHFIIWGALVLVCYPLLNWFELAGDLRGMAWLGGGALLLGAVLSFTLEMRLARRPRLTGENTFVSRQVTRIVAINIGFGALLSAIGPGSGLVAPDAVPLVWGLAYANMAYMIGVVYRPEYLVAGLAIGAGALVAWFVPGYRGFILGPFMGLGMIIPGVLAERRVARMRG